jgi:hypothetical protein
VDLDHRFILVFVRQDMYPDHQMVHGVHLGLLIGKALDGFCQKRHVLTGHPSVLLYGEPDEAALLARVLEMGKLGIEVIEWRDPDSPPGHDDFGLTGIITEPITKPQRNKLPRFCQWSASKNQLGAQSA